LKGDLKVKRTLRKRPKAHRKVVVAMMGLLSTPAILLAQTTFSPEFIPLGGSESSPTLQVDLNGDGTPDFLVSTFSASTYALLSNGTGGYTRRTYTNGTPGSTDVPIASGEFNGDGRADVLFYNYTGGSHLLYVAYGDAHGGFPTRQNVPSPPGVTTGSNDGLVGRTADFNGDGRPDVVIAYPVPGPSGFHVTVQLYLNNGNGFNAPITVFNFSAPNGVGTQSDTLEPFDLLLGDYDADGHADLALRVQATDASNPFSGHTTLNVLYGDGRGHFTPRTVFSRRSSFIKLAAADINDDTRTDLVGADTDGVHIFYSRAGRTFSESTITTPNVLTYTPMLADFDGNGLKDISFASGNYPADQTTGFRALYQQTQGVFALGPYKSLDTFNGQRGDSALRETFLGDFNHDGKPDAGLALATVQNHPNSAALLLNTGRFAIGSCPAPALGIRVCSPGSTSPGQVRFAFSATSFYPVRKMELWVDGVKRSETFHVMADQGYADVTLSLTPGGHRIGLYSGTYDGSVTQRTFNIQVQ
jgi:hypothetical protein